MLGKAIRTKDRLQAQAREAKDKFKPNLSKSVFVEKCLQKWVSDSNRRRQAVAAEAKKEIRSSMNH